jgi:hypothetical protein
MDVDRGEGWPPSLGPALGWDMVAKDFAVGSHVLNTSSCANHPSLAGWRQLKNVL